MALRTVKYAGHSAVFVESEKMVIGIDPWLEGNPLCPEDLRNPKKLDLIVLTHGHADHAGDALRLAKQYGCKVAATYELAMILTNEGVPSHNVIPMNKGGSVQQEDLRVTLTHAMHSSSYDSAAGPIYAGEPCGVVLSDETRSVYHAGDTALFSDMKLIGERYHPTLAFLPIGDRFTMGPEEAAKSASLIGCKIAIPIHYKTFDLLTGRADRFAKECSKYGVEAVELEPGAELKIT